MPASISLTTLEKFSTFGDLLRFLRRRVGITQIELATAVGYSDTQISRLEQNLRLPDIPTIEARFVSALDLGEEPNAVARLLDLAANVRREDSPGLGLCPYKGLNYFDETDADLFVGREALTTRLIERVFSLDSGSPRFFAIVGASGSGKSSLVRAGLVSALRWNQDSTDWHIHVLTPTAHPLESLAASLTQGTNSVVATATLMDDLAQEPRSLQIFAKRKLASSNGSRLLLVIDQFEELFALCRSEEERVSFIENLLTSASEADGPVILLITLRADFYAHCANYTQLREALAKNQEYIGSMNDEELRRAIEEPARRGRWEFEPGLIDLLLHDVGHEPGALPLLSHALLETWQRRRGRTMTLSGYAASGGVRGAIAETAETVFSDQFTHDQRTIARRIFLRLTELGDESGAGDTRRRATFSELILKPEETTTTRAVLKALADARLITTSENAAEVAHEALIREWPTLHGWLEENREGLRLHRQLTEAAQEWLREERSADLLYRGARLAQAREWALTHESEMNELEVSFLSASIEFNERETEEREAQRQRELEAAQKLAESERQRAEEETNFSKQLSRRALYLTGAFVVASLMTVAALFFARQTQATARLAASRELASASTLNLDVDPERSVLLALQAESTAHTIEAENALHRSIQASRVTLVLHHDAEIWSITYSPDGERIATASQDTTAKIWDADTGQLQLTLVGHTESVNGIVFSPDEKRVATTSDDHTAKVWDANTGELLHTLSGHTAWVARIAFSPDGTRLATTSGDVMAKVWDADTGEELLTFSGHEDIVWDVAFHPDGKRIATCANDGVVRIWDASSGVEILALPVEDGVDMRGVAFSPDGTRVAVASDGLDRVKVWDVNTGEVLLSNDVGHIEFPVDIAFSPDGNLAATAGGDDPNARVWDPVTGEVLYTLWGHTSGIAGVAFSPDGKRLATSSWDSTARVWDITPSKESLFIPRDLQSEEPDSEWTFDVRYSPDGTKILTDDPADNAAKLWDARTGKELLTFEGPIDFLDYSPDGKMVAGSHFDTITVWETKTGKELFKLVGRNEFISSLDFSTDGTRLASASFDRTVRIWDLASRKALLTFEDPENSFFTVAYSPDGKRVAAGGGYGLGHVWDAITGQELFTLSMDDTIFDAAFSPDGKRLAVANRFGTIRIWDAVHGNELLTLRSDVGRVRNIAFSQDGKRVATASDDGTARVWDATTGVNLLTLLLEGDEAGDVSFSPDGRRLAVGGVSGVYVFILPTDELIALAKSSVTRELTTEECQQYLHMEQCPAEP